VIAAAILAAGADRRCGQPTQLLSWRGTTLVRVIATETCSVANIGETAIVLGAHADLIIPELAGLPIAPLAIPPWATHVSSSLRVAVGWARERGAEALALVGCDQPRITAKHVERLCGAFRMTGRSAASRFGGALHLPAVIGATDFEALLHEGIPIAIAAAFPVPWPDGAFDLDHSPSLAAAIRRRIS
jgi:molybdenum cofactor cytidylyltransferase